MKLDFIGDDICLFVAVLVLLYGNAMRKAGVFMPEREKSAIATVISERLRSEALTKCNELFELPHFATELLTLTYSVREAATILGIGRESAY